MPGVGSPAASFMPNGTVSMLKTTSSALLEVARQTEPFTLLIAKLACETDDTPALAYRFEPYEELS
jgi:hypothetical protein